MRGLSLVEAEVLCSDWFIMTLMSSCSTFLAAWGSKSITAHMVMATLWRTRALSVGTPRSKAGLKSLGRVLGPLCQGESSPKVW